MCRLNGCPLFRGTNETGCSDYSVAGAATDVAFRVHSTGFYRL